MGTLGESYHGEVSFLNEFYVKETYLVIEDCLREVSLFVEVSPGEIGYLMWLMESSSGEICLLDKFCC